MTCKIFDKLNITGKDSCSSCMISVCFNYFGCAMNRTSIRERLNIQGNYQQDLCLHCFCHCCAIIQEYREVHEYNNSQTQINPDINMIKNVVDLKQNNKSNIMPPNDFCKIQIMNNQQEIAKELSQSQTKLSTLDPFQVEMQSNSQQVKQIQVKKINGGSKGIKKMQYEIEFKRV